MINFAALNKKLEELAALDKTPWQAFQESEKEYAPPTHNPIRAVIVTEQLIKDGYLKRRYHYSIYLFFALICGFFTVFYSPWLFIPYVFFLAITAKSRTRFMQAYATKKLGSSQFIDKAFGIESPSLAAAGVIKLRDSGGAKITRDSITSLLKITKASHDFGDINFGIFEAIKKSLFGIPIAAILWIHSNSETFSKYTTAFAQAAAQQKIIFLIVGMFLLGVSFICYDLVLGQTIAKRQKKKYVLVLTIICESFQDKR